MPFVGLITRQLAATPTLMHFLKGAYSMARHTFLLGNGRRIRLCPSPIEVGSIQLQLLDADRSNIGTFTIPAETAVVIADALIIEANTAAELLAWGN